MSLWGNKELVANAGTVAIDLSTGVITGSGTTFDTTGYKAKVGDVIVVGTGATMGYAVISSVTDDTNISVATTQYLIADTTVPTAIPAGASYYISEMPVYTMEDPMLAAPEAKSVDGVLQKTDVIYGVDAGEQTTANAASGVARKYAAPHAGWVGVTTYNNWDGTMRVKTETLVAGGEDSSGSGGIASANVSDREDTTYTG